MYLLSYQTQLLPEVRWARDQAQAALDALEAECARMAAEWRRGGTAAASAAPHRGSVELVGGRGLICTVVAAPAGRGQGAPVTPKETPRPVSPSCPCLKQFQLRKVHRLYRLDRD